MKEHEYEDYCWSHHRREGPLEGTLYLRCGECFHIFRTEKDLEDALLTEWDEIKKAEEIWSCPFCVHDF